MTADTDRRQFIQAGLALGVLAAATVPAAAQQPQKLRPKLSAHALDTYSGKQAAGILIDLLALECNPSRVLKSVVTHAEGRPPEGPLVPPEGMRAGRYQTVVYVGDYYKRIGAKVPNGYYTKLILEFDIYDPKQPHHLPFQITPWTQSASVLPG
jgi:5-hydroxyisourate hydrolase-like protein (transthyretin family)